jgi:hypothetical protein
MMRRAFMPGSGWRPFDEPLPSEMLSTRRLSKTGFVTTPGLSAASPARGLGLRKHPDVDFEPLLTAVGGEIASLAYPLTVRHVSAVCDSVERATQSKGWPRQQGEV